MDLLAQARENVNLALDTAEGILIEKGMQTSDANRCRVARMLLQEVVNTKEVLREKAKFEASQKVVEPYQVAYVNDHYVVAEKASPTKQKEENHG